MGKILSDVITSTSYDGKHTLEFRVSSHRYQLDGEPVRGATTIGSVYPKGEGLIKWLIDQGPEAYESRKVLKDAGNIGTILHTYAECYETKADFDWKQVEGHEHEQTIRRVIDRFTVWRAGNSDEVVRAEDIIASPSLRVGGRIDTLRRRETLGLVLSDYKTAKDIYITHLIQVIGGYRRMAREWLNLDVPYVEIVTFPKLAKDDMKILLADKDGWVKDGVRTDIPNLFEKVEMQFERNAATYQFQKEVEEVLTPPYYRRK